ncbi:hypothetical protein Patl1_36694 [Pistacia atlantica]|nr:hypothetical protein Patl1_36694 [Pistacia atlantica]
MVILFPKQSMHLTCSLGLALLMMFILLANSCLLHVSPIILLSYGFYDTSKALSLWISYFLLTAYNSYVFILMLTRQGILLIDIPPLGIFSSLVTHSSLGEVRNN